MVFSEDLRVGPVGFERGPVVREKMRFGTKIRKARGETVSSHVCR